MINLFDDLPARAPEEIVTELLLRKGVRIERIVSTGQSTPADKPYNQDHDEWVLLLTGSARIKAGTTVTFTNVGDLPHDDRLSWRPVSRRARPRSSAPS